MLTRRLLLRTECLPASEAVFTHPTCTMQPSNTNSIPYFVLGDPLTDLMDDTHPFMTRYQWHLSFHRPETPTIMKVSVYNEGEGVGEYCV